jgi:5-methylcytosine-specific restriction endonuclease McrA
MKYERPEDELAVIERLSWKLANPSWQPKRWPNDVDACVQRLLTTRRPLTCDDFWRLSSGPGSRQCAWCLSRIDKTNKRIRYCSDDCQSEVYRRLVPGHVRTLLWERDEGRCGICGVECRDWHWRIIDGVRVEDTRPDWQADHVVPVEQGGSFCGLDNYQTLCENCHKCKTAEQVGRKAKRRQEAEQLPLFEPQR